MAFYNLFQANNFDKPEYLSISKHQRTPQDDASTFLVLMVGLTIHTVREVHQVPDIYHLLNTLATIIGILTYA